MTTDTTNDLRANVRASRMRVARSRGALSGILLIIFGAWAALIPFIGPYFNFAFTPSPNDAWHWTTERGVFEVLPGAAAALGGLLLLVSANRLVALFGGWLAAAGGAWLIVGPSLSSSIGLKHLGSPDPSSKSGVQTLEELLFFFAIGAAILLVAALAIGRLSVHSVRDVRAAEKRSAAEAAAAEEQRKSEEHSARERELDERAANERAGRHEGDNRDSRGSAPVGDDNRTGDGSRGADGATGGQPAPQGGAHTFDPNRDQNPAQHGAPQQGAQQQGAQQQGYPQGPPPQGYQQAGYPQGQPGYQQQPYPQQQPPAAPPRNG